MEHRPATMFALNAPKIHSDFGLSVGRDAVHVVLKQHVLGRDGSIRLQLENPMPVASLAPQQGAAGTSNALQDLGRGEACSVFIAVLVRGWIGEKGLSG